MRKFTPADIDAAKQAKPGYSLILMEDRRTGDEFIFAVPRRSDYAKFQAMVSEDATRTDAMRILVDGASVNPTGEANAALFDDQPGLIVSFGNELLTACGQGVALTVKKL
jgi:hypothetical protein